MGVVRNSLEKSGTGAERTLSMHPLDPGGPQYREEESCPGI
jgi:hypothetical protein